MGRANEENMFINGQPVTALLDTGSQVTHVSHDYCVANGIDINPIAKLVNIEGTGGDSIEYVGYAEASLSLPMGSHTFNIDALLLVLPTTEYLKKVPVSIGTTITDVVVDYINQHKPDNMSKSWKVVCCATHTRKLIQAQPNSKRAVKTTKPVTLPPFSTIVVKGNTKFKSHGMRLNLIAESPMVPSYHLGYSVHLPTVPWSLAPAGISRVEESVGKAHYHSSRSVVGHLQQATIQKVHASGSKQGPTDKGGAWVSRSIESRRA